MNFINLKRQSLSALKSCDTSISYFKDYLPYQQHWVLHSTTFQLKAFFIYTTFFNQPVSIQCQYKWTAQRRKIIDIHQHMQMVVLYVTGVYKWMQAQCKEWIILNLDSTFTFTQFCASYIWSGLKSSPLFVINKVT